MERYSGEYVQANERTGLQKNIDILKTMIQQIEDAINNPNPDLVHKTRDRIQHGIKECDEKINDHRNKIKILESHFESSLSAVKELVELSMRTEYEIIELLETRSRELSISLKSMTDESILRDHIAYHQNLLIDKKSELEKLQNQLNALNEQTGKK